MNNHLKKPSFYEKKKAFISFKINRYFWIFILLLVTEIAIAIFHFHKFIRGFVGDVLVIPLLWSLFKWITPFSTKWILGFISSLAIFVEIAQYGKLLHLLGINSKILTLILGNTFDLLDILAYILGAIMVHYLTFRQVK